MPSALVLINVDIGKENDVFEQLLSLESVREVYMVYGIHDLIAVVDAGSMDELRDLITSKIRKIDGVKSTLTAIVVMHKAKGK